MFRARRQGSIRGARPLAAACAVAVCLLAAPTLGVASHSGGGGPRDFMAGSGTNQFFFVIGEAHLSGAAHEGRDGEPTGHIHAKGDPDGPGPMEPFKLEGEVTCLEVTGNVASIKYEFKHAEGSASDFEGGGIQIFIEDNGNPTGGQAVDRSGFEDPEIEEVFQPMRHVCHPPHEPMDRIESGNFVVHAGTP